MTKRVAFIGTGGTIASIGKGPLDTVDYGANGMLLQADGILARFPEVQQVAEVFAVPYRNVPSPQIGWAEWRQLVLLCDQVAAENPGLSGIVIGHGTASLEETAYFLSLTLKVAVPVVVMGAQRPASALSTDAGLNLVNAVRVAASEEARGLGALVLLNDEIQAAREVTKTSTGRMQTFRSADFGALGHADGDRLAWYRRPLRRLAPDTEFDIRGLDALPRVDIAYAYADADGTAVRAFTAAGAKGIVAAGFAPGFVTPGDAEALRAARAAGVVVVQSTRAGSGRVFPTTKLREAGFIPADNLTPQKARILLALALTVTSDPVEIARIFATY
ncbi:L-asparaginase [Siccirubricoccus deserti]|uniref:Asparaginase n=1 Tax=Siccirubricoccus deserti TaxID=2013562 RepID=A0A9X0UD21_9PROT|nr:asparaginase [Siccirubricoccus deserti]MBC4015073.1 asparaginase [Siccirubricoccus deserti]GGC35830.1 L-asparaginase [Siccirubricoccus deserti]